jgi:hypothetical protein
MTDNCKKECEGCDEDVDPVDCCINRECKEPLSGWHIGFCVECLGEDDNGISNAFCQKCKRECPECELPACDPEGSPMMVTYCYPLSGTPWRSWLDGPLAFQYPHDMCRSCCATNFGALCVQGHSSPRFGDLCCTICLIACLASAMRSKTLNSITAEFLLSYLIPNDEEDSITNSLENASWVLFRIADQKRALSKPKQALLKL